MKLAKGVQYQQLSHPVPSQGGHGELDIAIETFSDCDRGQLSDEGNDDNLGLRNILLSRQ
jgi:hypothetical protein